jgi:hypothetical protein
VNLEKYTELTGETIAPSQEAKFKATIRRTKTTLETMLGFSLKPKNLYTERGKVQFEGYLPILDDFDNLLEPDEEQGTYKLFPYNENDKFFHVDPFTNLYHVKLVMPINDGEFVTIVELDNVVAQYGRDGIAKYIERHWAWFTWEWYHTYKYGFTSADDEGLMLAVDADWLNCYPDDLNYIWVDMITHYADPNNNIKSESVDGHSWSKDDMTKPEYSIQSQKIISRYAGPFGAASKVRVR